MGMGNSLEGCCTPTQGMESVNMEGRPRHPSNGGRGAAWGSVAPGHRENPTVSGPPGHDSRVKPPPSPRMQQAAEEIQQVLSTKLSHAGRLETQGCGLRVESHVDLRSLNDGFRLCAPLSPGDNRKISNTMRKSQVLCEGVLCCTEN